MDAWKRVWGVRQFSVDPRTHDMPGNRVTLSIYDATEAVCARSI